MPLILAIEPDRRQATQLTTIVRQRLGADLVLADTTERALGAIGNRVPDLVLVPALLSPQDDEALATALRVIATAAHVQMLTIPVLAAKKSKRGVLSALLGGDEHSADGCDPAVFADQITSYLAEAAQERAARERVAAIDSFEPASSVRADAGAAVRDEAPVIVEFAEPIPAYYDVAPPVERLAPRVEETVPPVESVAHEEPGAELPPIVEQPPVPELAAHVAYATQDEPSSAVEATDFEEIAPVEEIVPPPLPAPARARSSISRFEEQLAALEVAALPIIEETQATTEIHATTWIQQSEPEIVEEAESDDIDLTAVLDEALAADEHTEPMRAIGFAPRLELVRPLEPVEQVAPLEAIASGEEPGPVVEPKAPPVDYPGPFQPIVVPISEIHLPETFSNAVTQFAHAMEALEPEVGDPWAPAPGAAVEPVPLGLWKMWPAIEGSEVEPTAGRAQNVQRAQAPVDQRRARAAAEPPVAPVGKPAPAVSKPVEQPQAAEPRAAAAPPQKGDHPEWVELIESLRRDIERLRTERLQPAAAAPPPPPAPPAPAPQPAPPPPPAAPAAEQAAAAAKPKPKRKANKPRPLQDEWGFFDPEQCGFAALLAKLDEISDEEGTTTTTTRRSA